MSRDLHGGLVVGERESCDSHLQQLFQLVRCRRSIDDSCQRNGIGGLLNERALLHHLRCMCDRSDTQQREGDPQHAEDGEASAVLMFMWALHERRHRFIRRRPPRGLVPLMQLLLRRQDSSDVRQKRNVLDWRSA